MFETFYGCERTPFARTIDSAHLYTPPVLEEIIGRLNYAAKRQLFDRAQTGIYLKKHLSAAGTERDIFSEAAIDAIYTYSGGIARLINKAATNCLIYGAQSQKPIIDDHMVKLVIGSEMAWSGSDRFSLSWDDGVLLGNLSARLGGTSQFFLPAPGEKKAGPILIKL